MSTSPDRTAAAVALNRFGLGVRSDEPLPADPRGWLLAQFDRYAPATPPWQAQPGSAALVIEYVDYQRALRQAGADTDPMLRQQQRRQTQARYRSAVDARVQSALTTSAPFVERLVHFWANHFAVSVEKAPLAALAGAFEREAIRPHVLGRFEDLLLAVEQHPAMLFYLDQVRSLGPDSAIGQRAARNNPARPRGLNENLAREILELHTLGVRSGYGQQDVVALARALTGWTVAGLPGLPGSSSAGEPGTARFVPAMHEPGERQLLGRRYAQRGGDQATAMLRDLAAQPATAQHIATKLVRHFVADTPPPALVARLAGAFERSQGDLPSVYRALVDAPEAWAATAPKFKTPWDWTLSALRGLGLDDLTGQPVAPLLAQLGQPVWRPGSPAGYDDLADSWLAPDSLLRRVEQAQRLADRVGSRRDARTLGPLWLPAGLSEPTARLIAQAESPTTGLALLLASPEFLRR